MAGLVSRTLTGDRCRHGGNDRQKRPLMRSSAKAHSPGVAPTTAPAGAGVMAGAFGEQHSGEADWGPRRYSAAQRTHTRVLAKCLVHTRIVEKSAGDRS